MDVRLVALGAVLAMVGCGTSHAQPTTEEAPAKVAPGPAPQATKTPSPEDEARRRRRIAKVGDVTITIGDVEDRINRQSPFLRSRYTDPERRMEFLRNMIRFELFARAAKEKGYDEDSEVRRQVKQMMVQVLTRKQFDERITAESITEEEIGAYYEEHRSDYNKPAMVRASHILVSDEAEAREVLETARDAKTDNRAFRRLAQGSSEDEATKARGGDLRYFARDGTPRRGAPEVPPEIVSVAFGLTKIGTVAPRLVKTSRGYHIVKLTGRRDPIHRGVEEVTPQIRNRLWRENRKQGMEDFVANLRERREVEVNDELLSLVKVNPPRGHGAEAPDPGR